MDKITNSAYSKTWLCTGIYLSLNVPKRLWPGVCALCHHLTVQIFGYLLVKQDFDNNKVIIC